LQHCALSLIAEPEEPVQGDAETEPSESEEKERVEPEPKPEPAKRKPPQVRPWDVGKEGVTEGEFICLFPCCFVCFFIHLVELYLHSSNMPSWRGARLKKHRDNFTLGK